MKAPRHNPFSTARVRPGAIPYLFPADSSADGLVARLRENAWWGQVVGPHGSGKSTLVAALAPRLVEAGRPVLSIALHDGERRLPIRFDEITAGGPSPILIVDGYEQLSGWNRFWLKRFCRRNGCGLLVTTHLPMGLPHLFTTTVSLELARDVVARLLEPQNQIITQSDIARALARHQGDLREMLFELYEIYEVRMNRKSLEAPSSDS